MAHYLAKDELKIISPKKEMKPKTYQLNAGQTLFLGALARVDYVKGERIMRLRLMCRMNWIFIARS